MARKRASGTTEPRITEPIRSVASALAAAEPRPDVLSGREAKKNYAERLSRALAVCIANHLRPQFAGITPDEFGRGQESRARTAKGYKKLDINYSTPELGLGLGVSVKTINFRDLDSKRYTKNYTRVDNELRAEASDYHERQPYSVLVGVLFLPLDACDDGVVAASSFAQAVKVLRHRDLRTSPRERAELMERLFVALYDPVSGATLFFDVRDDPPPRGRPPSEQALSFEQFINEIVRVFDERNR